MKLLQIPFFDEHKLILHNSIIALWYDFDRNTLLFTRAIRNTRNTIECTLREHSIVMNRASMLSAASHLIFAYKKVRVNCNGNTIYCDFVVKLFEKW